MAGCANRRTSASQLINDKASLSGGLPLNPFQWRVVSSSINGRESTMCTLYGNDLAVQHARTDPQDPYPAGSILSLVTWFQQEDDHWFGARIPGGIKTVEFITVDSSPDKTPTYTYQSYEGTPLRKASNEEITDLNNRIKNVLSQRAAVMP